MYDIEKFTIKTYLSETYPTNDDEECKKTILLEMKDILGSLKGIGAEEKNQFLLSFSNRIDAISFLCVNVSNMDDCFVNSVDCIAQSIDDDFQYLIRDRKDVIKLGNGAYFLNLSAIPDAVRFMQVLKYNSNLRQQMRRREIELLYQSCNMQSSFSNVLFAMSWMQFLRVYNKNIIYFNYSVPVFV